MKIHDLMGGGERGHTFRKEKFKPENIFFTGYK